MTKQQGKRPPVGKDKQQQQRVKHVRRARKPHPTDGWYSLGQRAHLKEN